MIVGLAMITRMIVGLASIGFAKSVREVASRVHDRSAEDEAISLSVLNHRELST